MVTNTYTLAIICTITQNYEPCFAYRKPGINNIQIATNGYCDNNRDKSHINMFKQVYDMQIRAHDWLVKENTIIIFYTNFLNKKLSDLSENGS